MSNMYCQTFTKFVCSQSTLCLSLFPFSLGRLFSQCWKWNLILRWTKWMFCTGKLTRDNGVKLEGPNHCGSLHLLPVILNRSLFFQFTADSGFRVKVSRKCPINNWAPYHGSQAEAGDSERPGSGGDWGPVTGPPAPWGRLPRTGVRSRDICSGAESRIRAFYHLYLLNNCRSIIALIMTKLQTLYKIHLFYQKKCRPGLIL